MRIDSVELKQIKLPMKAPFETSFGLQTERTLILVKVNAEGAAGWGEASQLQDPWYNYEYTDTAWYILKDYLIPSVLGKDFKDPDEFKKAYGFVRGHNFAKGGLENAFWDTYARSLNQPLARVLGGVKERIDVGVSIGIQKSPADLVRAVEGFVAQGYKRIKIKIKPGRDYDDLKAVRDRFPDVPIMADANSAYRLEDIPLFQKMDGLNLMMFEQPLAWDDIVDHAKLQRAVQTPICLDESVHSVEDARKALDLGSCRIINIKVGRVGGHSGAKAIHDLMESRGLPVWCGGMFECGVGRAHNIALTSLPNFRLPGDTSASERYYYEDVVDEPAKLNPDGTISVPERPGIGVEVLPGQLEKYLQREYSAKA